ncbi:glycoside hydrolase family 68 protein [uncultured Sphingomonas sp.]|uniref:glycoside hydrolase family 68 protein n=1 Tax=uncultured Sphingomonas sp. TaxID=158754 RepID=UPI0025E3755B|nr:glycoside hydrolase family 68 protein [uncultured Sphingomonas sp.]
MREEPVESIIVPRPGEGAARWCGARLSRVGIAAAQTIPAFALDPARRIPGHDLWDMWPIETADGRQARGSGGNLWLALAAPAAADPEARHAVARIHLVVERETGWHLGAPVLPDGFSAGSREWSGSALLDPETGRITLFYTAAGRRGEPTTSFEQRLFQLSFALEARDDGLHAVDHRDHQLSVAADEYWYMTVDQREGVAGMIKAFRDPAFFRDPATGRWRLFFTGSAAGSASAWNGVIGMAEAVDGSLLAWRLAPPVVDADTLNNELERPHMRRFDGLYYLFWSTQAKVFAPDGPIGPTGLYGMVSASAAGPFEPLNGTGLVAANPEEAPFQAYSWWVLPDLRVTSFADLPGVAAADAPADVARRRAAFAGYPAPYFRLTLNGNRAGIA